MTASWQWILACICSVTVTQAVEVGDSVAAVRAELGPPTGRMTLGDRAFFLYPHGTVAFCDGVVEELALEDPHAHEKRLQLEAEQRDEERALAAIQQEALQKEGEALRVEILSSPSYIEASAGERVRLWGKFRSKYPGVDIAEIYLAELKKYEREQLLERRIAQQEARIAQLERRVNEVESEPARVHVRMEEPRRVYYPVSYVVPRRVRATTDCERPDTAPRTADVQTTYRTTYSGSFVPLSSRLLSAQGGYSYPAYFTSFQRIMK